MLKFHRLFLCFAVLLILKPAQAQILTGYGAPAPEAQSVIYEDPSAPVVQPEPVFKPWQPVMTGTAPDAEAGPPPNPEDAVDLDAENVSYDEQAQVVTASGNVFLTQAGRILRADEIAYDLKTDTAKARGHVVLSERNADIHYSEEVEFNDQLKDGFVKGLKSYLADGSRFTAEKGKRKDGTKTTMEDASYTPCEPCKAEPDKPPVWQIVAAKVRHDEEEHRISYTHARFEVYGVPVAYVPYFSHPDGTIERKSGFLAPRGGFKSGLGTFGEARYYWNIAPDKDATFGLMAMTDQDPLFSTQWRQRWDRASLVFDGAITNSSRTENKNGIDQRISEEVRGHVFANGLWDMNDKWRSGLNVAWASDDQYMRQYDFTNEDVLESELYAERFSGRDYAVARLLSFQDIRVRQVIQDQPNVLPEIQMSFLGEPGAMPLLKGRWGLDASLLGLQRGGDNQDMTRMSLGLGWERRMVSQYGLLTRMEANLHGDVYHISDRDIATPGSGRSRDSSQGRFFPNLHVQSSYPLVNNFERFQATIEPIVSITAAPNIDVSGDIPNEDSQDVQIDASNIFESNRFPGLDRVEDQSRVTYGVRSGVYGYGGSYANVFLGQSYRLTDDDNPFPAGSGLDQQESDLVGQISARYGTLYNLDYRFQLDSKNISSQRHEVDAFINGDRLSGGTRYLYAKGLEGTGLDESREQVQLWSDYKFNDAWRTFMGGTQDMGSEAGLRQAYLGFQYMGQCYSWSLRGERNLTDDATGESDTEIVLRIGLKNLGEFDAGGVTVDNKSN